MLNKSVLVCDVTTNFNLPPPDSQLTPWPWLTARKKESPPSGLHKEAPEKTGRLACELAKPGSHPSQNLEPGAQGSAGSDKAVIGLEIYSEFASHMILSLRDL